MLLILTWRVYVYHFGEYKTLAFALPLVRRIFKPLRLQADFGEISNLRSLILRVRSPAGAFGPGLNDMCSSPSDRRTGCRILVSQKG